MEHNSLLQAIIPFISSYGLWIVFFGMIVEGTIMIIISGILCYMGLLPIDSTLIVALLGAISGDHMWYFIGRKFSNTLFTKFPSLRKKSEKLTPSINKKGALLAFGSRFVYAGAILLPLTLGAYNFSHKKFTIFDTLGVMLWSILGLSLGYFLGTSAESLFGKISKIEHFASLVIIIVLFIWSIKYYFTNKYTKDKRYHE